MSKEIERILDYLRDEKSYLHYGIRREKFIELEGKEVQTLLDYITNLQEDKITLIEETGRLKSYKDLYKDLLNQSEDTIKQLIKIANEYKSRIEKSIEYLTDEKREFSEDCYYKVCELVETEDLLNILNGGSNE